MLVVMVYRIGRKDTTMKMTTVERLHKTRKTILAFINRGGSLGTGDRPNYRGCELKDRYDTLRNELTNVGGYQNSDWIQYCNDTGSCVTHDGFDLFC